MTGADSPVMADSSTEPMPSTTSPSAGITCPRSTSDEVAALEVGRGTSSIAPLSVRRWARVVVRVARSVSAWALPRPSAIASAKLANRTVSHSQNDDDGGEPQRRALAAERRRGWRYRW